MKVTGPLLITLSLAVLTQANLDDYRLSCTKDEMGIRWPSYVSHSDYYVCPRIGGRQMTITCKPGEVFTYVLQSCTKPSQYIPAPALQLLKISSNKPTGPLDNHPPFVSQFKPPAFETPFMKPQHPPVWTDDAPKPPLALIDEPKQEAKPFNKEEPKTEEHEIVKPSKPAELPPMPPTPAPTPPVVVPAGESVKKPSLSKKPTAAKKKSSTKPSKNGKKKPTAEKTAKKSPKKSKQTPKKSPAKKAPTEA